MVTFVLSRDFKYIKDAFAYKLHEISKPFEKYASSALRCARAKTTKRVQGGQTSPQQFVR
jgi:hypothetical protein